MTKELLQDEKEVKTKKASSTIGLDFLINGSIFMIFFLTPLFFTGLVAQGMGFEKMSLFYLLVLVGLVSWVAKGVILGKLNLKRTPLDVPVLLFLFFIFLSTIFSVSIKDSLIGSYGNISKGLIAIVIYVLFYYLLVNNINAKKLKIYFSGLMASSAVIVIFTILQLRGIYILKAIFPFTANQSFNFLGSISSLTIYLVIILPLLIVTVAQTDKIFPVLKKGINIALKIFFGLVLILDITILALLNGFTFWPIAVVSSVIVLMFYMAKIIKINNNNLIIPLTTFLLLIIFLVLGNFQFSKLTIPAEVSLSRDASWRIAEESVKNDPFIGSGPSTFYYSFSKYRSKTFNSSQLWNIRFDSATGSIYESLATLGIVGTLILLIITLIALSTSFLSVLKAKISDINPINLGLFASLVTIVLYALFFSRNNSLILLSIMISCLALAASYVAYTDKENIIKLSFRASAKYALALASIFLCVCAGVVIVFTLGVKMYTADAYAKKALVTSDTQDKITLLQKATEYAPYQDTYYFTLANNYLALANEKALAGGEQGEVSDLLTLAINAGQKAVDISPNKAKNNESQGLIYENASFYTRDALESAESSYNRVMELDPNNPTPYLRLALVNMAKANTETDKTEQKYYLEEAIKKYDEAITLKSDMASAFYGKSIAEERLGDIDDAIEQLKAASILSKDNLDYRFELGRLFFNRGVSQSGLKQNATKEITEDELLSGEAANGALSVEQPSTDNKGSIEMNNDLFAAEQLFLSILLVNENHANARYSLAVLYQKVGDLEKAKIMIDRLLEVVTDEKTQAAIKEQFADIL